MDGSVVRLWTISGREEERGMIGKGIKRWERRWWRRLLCRCRRQRRGRQREITANLGWAARTHLLIEKWISSALLQQNQNDQILVLPPNPFFCVCLNCQVACCCDWSFLSELRPKTNWIVVLLQNKKGNTNARCTAENTSPIDGQHTDSQLGTPFLISHGKNLKVSQLLDKLKIKLQRHGKLLKGSVLFLQSATLTCYQLSKNVNTSAEITLCGGKQKRLEGRAEVEISLFFDSPCSCVVKQWHWAWRQTQDKS